MKKTTNYLYSFFCLISILSINLNGLNSYQNMYNAYPGNLQSTSGFSQYNINPNIINAQSQANTATNFQQINIATYLVNRYLKKEIKFYDALTREYKTGYVKGISLDENSSYLIVLNTNDVVDVQFTNVGKAQPSNRMPQSQVDTLMMQQLQMQQMLTQSLGGIMSANNAGSTMMDNTGLTSLEGTLPLNQFTSQQLNQDHIAFFIDQEVKYVNNDNGKTYTGIPDYLTQDQYIVLKDGTKIKERFVKIYAR